jgi:hypothetical protein
MCYLFSQALGFGKSSPYVNFIIGNKHKTKWAGGCSSMVEDLPSISKALGFIPTIATNKNQKSKNKKSNQYGLL